MDPTDNAAEKVQFFHQKVIAFVNRISYAPTI